MPSCNGPSVFQAAKNLEHQGHMIDHGFRECVEHKVPYYVPTLEMAADIPTKPLDQQLVVNGISMLGLQMETEDEPHQGYLARIYLDFSGFILALWCDPWPESSC
jgi:hypothetical protein